MFTHLCFNLLQFFFVLGCESNMKYVSPVFPLFHTVTTVSWYQKRVQNDNIHSIILDVHVFKVWRLKNSFLCRAMLANQISRHIRTVFQIKDPAWTLSNFTGGQTRHARGSVQRAIHYIYLNIFRALKIHKSFGVGWTNHFSFYVCGLVYSVKYFGIFSLTAKIAKILARTIIPCYRDRQLLEYWFTYLGRHWNKDTPWITPHFFYPKLRIKMCI